MTSDEFRALLKRDRRKALLEYFETWLDANSESRRDTIQSLASLAEYKGVPRIEVGTDDDLADGYDTMVDNDEEPDDEC